jgi:hypothetical protein
LLQQESKMTEEDWTTPTLLQEADDKVENIEQRRAERGYLGSSALQPVTQRADGSEYEQMRQGIEPRG